MPIPLYFAADCKEIVTISETLNRALTGFGVYPDGTSRFPDTAVSALAVIDDAILCETPPGPETLDALAACCGQGCFFDFMRPAAGLHSALILGLQQRLPRAVPLFVPERYHAMAPNTVCVLSRATPCNHWERYVAEKSARYPSGWCLELIPWDRRFSRKGECRTARHIALACCELEETPEGLRYFDTPETLKQRLEIAERYGCCAAIGLYCELKKLA